MIWKVKARNINFGYKNYRAIEVLYSLCDSEVDRDGQLKHCTRNLLMLHDVHDPRTDSDRLYMNGAKIRRGLLSVKTCVHIEDESFQRYLSESEETIMTAVWGKDIIKREVKYKIKNTRRTWKSTTQQRIT